MTTDFRALCVELTDCLEKADWPHRYKVVFQQWTDIAHAALSEPEPEGPSDQEIYDLWTGAEPASFARAVLARSGNPAPAPPSDGGVAELVETLKGIAYWKRHGRPGDPVPAPFDIHQADRLDRAAELLQRQALVPVPVSERLPGPEDCDAEGMCWWWSPETLERVGCWMLSRGTGAEMRWLPAYALPLPEVK